MGLIYADRIKELSNTYGTTDTFSLAGAVSGFRTFASAMAVGDTCYYCIDGLSTGEWETGLGTLTGSTSFQRTTTIVSSNSNLPVDFSAGTKNIYLTVSTAALQTLQVKQQTAIMSQNDAVNITGTAILNVYESGGVTSSNKVPVMTSDAAPSGQVTYSSQNGSTYAGYMAFDATDGASYWMATAVPAWLGYQFPSPTRITAYSIDCLASGMNNNYKPKDWTLSGSNDGSTWTTLDTQSGVLIWASVNTYTVAAPASYTYYKINVTAVQSGSSAVEINRLMLLSPDNAGTSNLVPVMTSNTAPSGVVTATKSNSSGSFIDASGVSTPWQAFDANAATMFSASFDPNYPPVHVTLAYDFGAPKIVGAYTLRCNLNSSYDSSGYEPKDWTLEGSTDGAIWTVLDTRVGVTALRSKTKQAYSVPAPTAYRHYRLHVTNNYGNNLFPYVMITDMELLAASTYSVLNPVSDYRIDKSFDSGVQALSVTRLKSGTSLFHAIDYI